MSKRRRSISGEPIAMIPCDECGRLFTEFEFVETIEEFLCERCASGHDPDEDDGCFDGQDSGYED